MNINYSLFHMAFLFFMVMDSYGNVPVIATLLKHFDMKTQRIIIIREMLIALAIMVLFLYFGHGFFSLLHVSQPSLQITGGIILFIIAIRMVFASPQHEKIVRIVKEPLIVPIAVPAISGPGILATITLYGGSTEVSKFYVLGAILIAWGCSLPIVLLSPQLKKWFGENGSVALERLFGYIIVLISCQMAADGVLAAFGINS